MTWCPSWFTYKNLKNRDDRAQASHDDGTPSEMGMSGNECMFGCKAFQTAACNSIPGARHMNVCFNL